MKIIRVILFLLLNSALTILWFWYGGEKFKYVILLPAIWVFPIIIVSFGFFIDKLLSLIKTNKKITSFYIGQLLSLIVAIIYCLVDAYSDWQHIKTFGNIEYNRANRNNTFFPVDTTYQARAFDALENNFIDKNSFRITDLFSDNKDSVINSTTTQIHISWFSYYLENDPKTILCAKYRVFNDTVINDYFNSKAMTNSDFCNRKEYKDRLLKAVEKYE